ncbi:hypothetical protein D3C87_1548850 [compost metagenome]
MAQAAIVECGEAHARRQPLHVLQGFQHVLAPARQVEQQVPHALVVRVVDVAPEQAARHGVGIGDDALRQVARRAPACIEQQLFLVHGQVGPVADKATGSQQRGGERAAEQRGEAGGVKVRHGGWGRGRAAGGDEPT